MDSIFYGLFLLMLDVNVGNIDLLPSFIGYYLMYRGLCQLESENSRFAEMKPWCIGMGVYSAIVFAASLLSVSFGSGSASPLSAGVTIAFLFILYRLIQGVQEMESKRGANLEGALLMRRWKNVCIVQVALYFMNGLLSFKPIRLGIVSVVLTLAAFVLYILFLLAFHRSRQAYYAALRTVNTEPAEATAYTPYKEPEDSSRPNDPNE